ncbi:hypothetical protein OROGR_014834 [Orobanche gracilis]
MNTKITCLVIFVLIVEATQAGSTCNLMQLIPCATTITTTSPPSTECCAKLKEQKPCLCGYMKNRSLTKFIKSAGALKVAKSCGVGHPRC